MSNKKTYKAFAPATVANVVCGFDILSFAIEHIGDSVEIIPNDSKELIIKEIVGGENLPKESEKNVCSVVINAMQSALNVQEGFDIYINKGYQAGSGLGSSAASSAAAAIAYNKYKNEAFSKLELVEFARQGELIACGSPIADNVAAAIYGGMLMVHSTAPLRIIELPVIPDLFVHVLFQQVVINTQMAREILPENVSMKTAINQAAAIAGLTSSLYTQNYELMKASLVDYLAEPFRSSLIPNFNTLKTIAMNTGALGFGISGSGPTVFSLCRGEQMALEIKQNIDHFCDQNKLEYVSLTSKFGAKGGF